MSNEKPISKDLIAASAVPLVLSILEQEDSYGYAIIKRVSELSGERIQWKDGMLYPVLHRLEEQGLIESYWRDSETGRKRKYYRIKQTGALELAEQRAQWRTVTETLARVWGDGQVLAAVLLGVRRASGVSLLSVQAPA
jgi:DNA-binding PadR family transcriptional regulator